MNSFFGSIQAPIDGNFDMSAPVFEDIPEGTIATAMIEEAKWDSYTPQEGATAGIEQVFIKCTWSIVDGEYKARKLFQKLHIQDPDQKKAMRNLQLLAAIDANAGGKIMAAGVAPDDMMLGVSIVNVPMSIKISVWDINGKTGNYISGVSKGTAPAPQQAPLSQGQAINQAVSNVQTQAPQTAPAYAPQQQAPQMAVQPNQMTPQQLQADDIAF